MPRKKSQGTKQSVTDDKKKKKSLPEKKAKRRGPEPRVPTKDLIEAINSKRGLLTQVSRYFKSIGNPISPQGIRSRMNTTPEIKEAADNARLDFVDECEVGLMKHVREGNLSAIIFALKCLGKDRGYIERGYLQLDANVSSNVSGEVRILRLPDNGRD